MTKRILTTVTKYEDPSDLFTQDEQKKQCCELVSCDPCVEVGRVDPYDSASKEHLDLDALLASARAAHPDINIVDVQVIDKGPTGPCGEMHTRWEGRLNCCDKIEPLEIDSDRSVAVMADSSSGVIFLAMESLKPLFVTVRGSGFFSNPGLSSKSEVYNGGDQVAVYTANACGTCVVRITDGCSVVEYGIRSTNGRWVDVTNTVSWRPLEGVAGEESTDNVFTVTQGGWRVTETQGYIVRSDLPKVPSGFTEDIMYWDPSLYWNVSCTGCAVCQDPVTCGTPELIRKNYYEPNVTYEVGVGTYLFPSIVEKLDGFVAGTSVELHMITPERGWLAREYGGTPSTFVRCGFTSASGRFDHESNNSGYWWAEPRGFFSIEQWVC